MTFVDGQTLSARQLNEAFAAVSAATPELIAALLPSAVAAALPSAVADLLSNLPDEANGDAIPSSGPYLSSGVLKFA